MPVALRIVDESEYGPEPRDITVPDGATITVRRHRQGADVVVEPGKAEAQPEARSWPDIKVPGTCDQCGAWVGFGGPSAPGRPDLRDMGATLVDKARARLLEAQAAKLEAENRDRHGPPPDDGRTPVQVERWKTSGRSDVGTVHATFFDREERGYELTLLPAQARELAEALLSGARFAETGRER